jgi:hypothetical protein
MAEKIKSEKMDYCIKLAYELLDRVEAGKETKAMASALCSGHPSVKPNLEKFAKLQDNYTEKWVIGDKNYRDAISTLEKEFGQIDSVKSILEKVYTTCPSLRPTK